MRSCVLLLLVCGLAKLFGQTNQLAGMVTDTGDQPIPGANLIAKDWPDGTIVSFSITDAEGNYQLPLPTGYDSVWVEVTHLTRNPIGRWLKIESQQLNWRLESRTHDLPTMEVTQQAVTRRGDTLIFDIAHLRENSDENLEQVIARIPGITIGPGGQIRYEDLAISRFYIEGLDLLEGRYAIATRNLNVDAIRDIEILERHQPIRALDSLVVPPNAAINIRLKSSLSIVGTAEGGVGFPPALYDVQGTGFGFTRQQQFNVIGSVSNSGKRRQNDYQNFYRTSEFIRPLVSPSLPRIPVDLPTEAYLDNEEITGSASFLRKFGEKRQFKINGFVATDAAKYQGDNFTRLRDESRTATFEEILSATQRMNHFNTRLRYEVNRDRYYLSTSVEIDNKENETEGNHIVNTATTGEEFDGEAFNIDGSFRAIVRRKQKAVQLWGTLNYREQEIALAVTPLTITVPEFMSLTLDTARQTARQSFINSNVYTNLNVRKGRFRTDGRGGLEIEQMTLSSHLRDMSTGTEDLPIDLFRNDTRQRILRPYLYQSVKRETDRHFWTLTLPVSVDMLAYEDQLQEDRLRQNLLIVKPDINYSYRFKKGQFLSVGYAYTLDYFREDQLFSGYILRRNRFFDRTTANVNRLREHQLSAGLRGNNSLAALHYQTSFNLSRTTTDLLTEASFDAEGESQGLIEQRNIRHTYNWQGRIDWAVNSDLELSLNTEYTLANYPILLNGISSRQSYDEAKLNLGGEWTFPQAVLRLTPELIRSFSELAETVQWRHKMITSYYQQLPRDWGAVRLAYTYQAFRSSNQTATTNLFDLSYERKILNNNWELQVTARNLLGTNSFRWLAIDTFSTASSSFTLRPRQMMVTIKRSI